MSQHPSRKLTTILFTDIVDSTSVGSSLGDARWRELLARHHILIRKELKRFGGREVDTAGDGFFATFAAPGVGTRCACSCIKQVRTLGIEIRAGLHIGEVEDMRPKVAGVAVVTASRIAAIAKPGEVLVSSTIEELVSGSGITFEDRGAVTLKGIEGDRRVFSVVEVDGSPLGSPLQKSDADARLSAIEPRSPIRRHPLLALTAVALLVAIGAAAFFLLRPQAIAIVPDSLAKIDPATNEVVADVPIAHPGDSTLVGVPGHGVWALSQADGVITVVDTSTLHTSTIGIAGGQGVSGYGITYGFGKVWVTGDDFVAAYDPVSRRVIDSLDIPGNPALLAQGFERVWVMVHDRSAVVGIDPTEFGVDIKGKIGAGGAGIAAGEGSVWVANYSSGTISKVDPATGTSTQTPVGFDVTNGGQLRHHPGGLSGIGIGFGSVWASDIQNGVVYRIEPTTAKILSTIRVGKPSTAYASDIVAADGSMWVASPASKTVVRIDPNTNRVIAEIPFSFTPNGLAVADGSVWVTINP